MNDYTQVRILKSLMRKLKLEAKAEGRSVIKHLEKILKDRQIK